MTMYTSSTVMHHGADRNCRTGICSLIRPTIPLCACSGKPKLRSASLRNGKFSNSTSPDNNPQKMEKISTKYQVVKNATHISIHLMSQIKIAHTHTYLIIGQLIIVRCSSCEHICQGNYSIPRRLTLLTCFSGHTLSFE